jgi:glycosyltransferase involved in cell wall biosynthesis
MDIAVIIPTHNRAGLLPAALDSVLAQTAAGEGCRIEAMVIDDGSTDGTAEVMRPYLDKHGAGQGDVTIRYDRLEKQGVVAARNHGIARTTAPLVAFLDSDDYWDATKLARQLPLLTGEVGLVHTAFRYVDQDGRFTDAGVQRAVNPCVGWCLDALMDEYLVITSAS